MTKAIEMVVGGTLKLLLREIDERAGCFITLSLGSFSITARGDQMAYTLASDMQVLVRVSYVDGNNNPATVDGDVTWESSDNAIAMVIPNTDDSFEATVRPGTEIGQVQISATADADLGEGVRELITLMDVSVVSGEAVSGVLAPVGDPTPIPQPKSV
jgi:hypothetical protein